MRANCFGKWHKLQKDIFLLRQFKGGCSSKQISDSRTSSEKQSKKTKVMQVVATTEVGTV